MTWGSHSGSGDICCTRLQRRSGRGFSEESTRVDGGRRDSALMTVALTCLKVYSGDRERRGLTES